MDTEVIAFRTERVEGFDDTIAGVLQRTLKFVYEGMRSKFPEAKDCFVFSKGKESEFFDQLKTGRLCMVLAEDGCALIRGLEEQEMNWLDESQRELGIEETAEFLIECAKHNCILGVSLLLSASQKEMSCIWARSNISLDKELVKIVFTAENRERYPELLSDCETRIPEELRKVILRSCQRDSTQDDKVKTAIEVKEHAPCGDDKTVEKPHEESQGWAEVSSPFSVRMCFNEEEMTPENHLLFERDSACIGMDMKSKDSIQDRLERAAQHWQERADMGNIAAMTNLGVCYASGRGVAANPKKAFQLWEMASEMGDEPGTFNLAMCCYNGIGTDVNKARAIELLTRAKHMGSNSASLILGMCYEKGEGVHQDFAMAANNYREARGSKVSETLLQRLQDKHLI